MKKDISKGKATRMVLAAACLALCLVLPFLTGQIPQMGNALCPMHLPVFLAGFICGPVWAAGVGFIAPLLRNMIFHMPPLYPTGISMSFELAAYGLVSGLLFRKLHGGTWTVYASLAGAMAAGRLVWGAVRVVMLGLSDIPFSWAVFVTEGFVNAIPGIIIQLILVPAIVIALRKARIVK